MQYGDSILRLYMHVGVLFLTHVTSSHRRANILRKLDPAVAQVFGGLCLDDDQSSHKVTSNKANDSERQLTVSTKSSGDQ